MLKTQGRPRARTGEALNSASDWVASSRLLADATILAPDCTCADGQPCTDEPLNPHPPPRKTPMNAAAIALLALAMSTDAFAAAVGKGAALQRPRFSEALRTGLIFGCIEAATPVVGWAIGSVAAAYVSAWAHWIAFAVLAGLGARMMWLGVSADKEDAAHDRPDSHGFWVLALTGLATSLDAMAVGVGLAFVDADIVKVALAIGMTTFLAVTAGVMLGRVLGMVAGKRAEFAGGLLLVGIGVAILVEHLRAH
jgi:putative Mn2+ efflux pump MntP